MMNYRIPTCVSMPLSLRRKLEDLRVQRQNRDERRITISALVEEAILSHFKLKEEQEHEKRD